MQKHSLISDLYSQISDFHCLKFCFQCFAKIVYYFYFKNFYSTLKRLHLSSITKELPCSRLHPKPRGIQNSKNNLTIFLYWIIHYWQQRSRINVILIDHSINDVLINYSIGLVVHLFESIRLSVGHKCPDTLSRNLFFMYLCLPNLVCCLLFKSR